MNCKFCYFLLITSIVSERVEEGRFITDFQCANCGAKFMRIVTIEGGPTKKNYVVNKRSEEEKNVVTATKHSV